MKPITEIMIMSDPGDCFWTDEGLIGLGELGLGDLSGLASEFTEWSISIEDKWPEFEGVDWPEFHRRGIGLSMKLKRIVGDSIKIVYRKTPEDPGYEADEYTEIQS